MKYGKTFLRKKFLLQRQKRNVGINKFNFNQIKSSLFDDLVIYLVIGIILGGRLGYVFFYNFEYYSNNFLEIFKLWQGGMSFHGGLIGVIASIIFFSKKTKTNVKKSDHDAYRTICDIPSKASESFYDDPFALFRYIDDISQMSHRVAIGGFGMC